MTKAPDMTRWNRFCAEQDAMIPARAAASGTPEFAKHIAKAKAHSEAFHAETERLKKAGLPY